MEGGFGVLWETLEEQLEEGIHIFSSRGTTVNLGTVIGIGISDVDGLIEEENVAVRIPRVLVVRHARFVDDLTGTQFKEQSRGRRTTGTTCGIIGQKFG